MHAAAVALLLLTKVLVVYADCEPSYADRIETAVTRAIRQAIGHLSEHPLFNWGKYRWFEGLIAAYWLYERTQEDWILDYCDLLHDQGKDYKKLIDEEFEQYYGRTYADSPDIDGRVWLASQEDLTEGTFVTVCIDGVVDGDLSGYVLEE